MIERKRGSAHERSWARYTCKQSRAIGMKRYRLNINISNGVWC